VRIVSVFLLLVYTGNAQIVIKDTVTINPSAKTNVKSLSESPLQSIPIPSCAQVNVQILSQTGTNLTGLGGIVFVNRGRADGIDDELNGSRFYSYSDKISELKFYIGVEYWTWLQGRIGIVAGPSANISPNMTNGWHNAFEEVRTDSGSVITQTIYQTGEYQYEVHMDFADSGWTYNTPPGFWNGDW